MIFLLFDENGCKKQNAAQQTEDPGDEVNDVIAREKKLKPFVTTLQFHVGTRMDDTGREAWQEQEERSKKGAAPTEQRDNKTLCVLLLPIGVQMDQSDQNQADENINQRIDDAPRVVAAHIEFGVAHRFHDDADQAIENEIGCA